MDYRMARLAVAATVLSVAVAFSAVPALAAGSAAPPTYTNHTVGGPAGWFFNDATNSSAANYSSWAASQSFYLGDYLIFNSNSNMTLLQTYNETTYGLCSADEDNGNETFVYSDDANAGLGVPEVAAVPLTVAGPNYYLTDDMFQCLQGMRFQITVGHGQGLPPDLSQPPPDAGTAPPTKKPPSVGSQGVSSPGLAFGTGVAGTAGMGAWSLVVVAVLGAVMVA